MQVPAAVETGRPRAVQDRQPLWTALNALLGLMDVPAMAHVMTHFPAFLDIAAQWALTGSAIAWPALSILRHIFSTLKGQVGPLTCISCMLAWRTCLAGASEIKSQHGLGSA